MATANIYYINDESFDKVTMGSKLPVLIDFYADWCGPCRTLSPVIEKVAERYAERVLVCKMNVDESPYVPNRYKISAIPTVMLFVDGLAAEKAVGLHDVDFYAGILDKHLKTDTAETQDEAAAANVEKSAEDEKR